MTTTAQAASQIAHTPGPWTAGGVTKDRYVSEGMFDLGDVNIFPPSGEAGPVAIVAGAANAAFIVRAVNAHADMLAALKEMVDEADSVSRERGWPLASRLDNARAAIARAESRT